jgi:hypothetical protein
MDRTDFRWGVWSSPHWLRHVVRLLLLAFFEQVLDGTRNLFKLPGSIKQIHLIVFVANFIGQAAGPCLDFVQLMLLLVVSGLANVDIHVGWRVPWPPFVEARKEHNEAAIDNFVDGMVAVLSSLDHFILIKVAIVAMDGLFWSIVPAGIDPLGAVLVLPGAVDLGYNRFG